MLIFHEGLPRSGKSYACCVDHIVPALKAGRHVYAHIQGLNHDKFAEVCELDLERVQELLHQIEADQVKEIYKHIGKDSLIVIDELQDFFPVGRQKLGDEITKFVTQHGHDGLDIVAMGQDHRDCHALWKRRIQRMMTFTKMTAVGMENRYKWEAYEFTAGGKSQKISSGVSKYDSKYFGLYKSHTDGTTNKGNLADDRINIFKTSGFRIGLPAFLVVLVVAINYVIGFFEEPPVNVPDLPSKPEPVYHEPAYTPPPVPFMTKPVDYFDEIAGGVGHRVRLAGHGKTAGRLWVVVEVYDTTLHLQGRFYMQDFMELGWIVGEKGGGIELSKGEVRHMALPGRIESWGRVAQSYEQQRRLAGNP